MIPGLRKYPIVQWGNKRYYLRRAYLLTINSIFKSNYKGEGQRCEDGKNGVMRCT